MTHSVDVDFAVLALKNAEISPREVSATREAESEPTISLVDAVLHLEEDITLGPVNHPRELRLLARIQCDLVHLIR